VITWPSHRRPAIRRPGTTFPIGTTSVTCVASDPSGNRASATFHVTVLSAQAQISNFKTSVINLALSTGITTSLLAKLNAQVAAANAGDVATACASLQDFINETRAQAGKKIAIADANTLSARLSASGQCWVADWEILTPCCFSRPKLPN